MTSVAAVQDRDSRDAFVSAESEQVARPIRDLLSIGWEMGLSTSVTETEWGVSWDTPTQRFERLARDWREACAHLSTIREMVVHPAYQQIIGMGPGAVPLIIKELQREPDHWFWALRAITGEDPVRPEHQGRVAEMAMDWLDWAKQRGIAW